MTLSQRTNQTADKLDETQTSTKKKGEGGDRGGDSVASVLILKERTARSTSLSDNAQSGL